jgi:hypothetical protein
MWWLQASMQQRGMPKGVVQRPSHYNMMAGMSQSSVKEDKPVIPCLMSSAPLTM